MTVRLYVAREVYMNVYIYMYILVIMWGIPLLFQIIPGCRNEPPDSDTATAENTRVPIGHIRSEECAYTYATQLCVVDLVV